MGDPKKIKKKYSTPSHPWQKSRIEQEIALKKEYGLKNKKEIWIIASKLKTFKDQLKRLNAMIGPQAEKEREQLRTKLLSLGLISQDAPLNTVLGLETKDLMERRLQTVVYRKQLSRTMNQARQFIVHRHISVNGKKITFPSYLVTLDEEDKIEFVQSSNFSDPNHPERYEEVNSKDEKKKEVKKKEKKEEEIVAFEEVPEDEEAIVKEIPKKEKVNEDSEKKEEDNSKSESSEEIKEEVASEKKVEEAKE